MGRDFLYGAATSAHQVEGDNVNNDWWEWETHRPVEMRSGRAAAHYELYREDFALARKLGHNAHRLSLEWSRIEPERDQWDKQALEHYREVLTELRRLGLRSMVTLQHFTLPQWFSESGGWLRSDAVDRFARYTQVVVEHLGDLVDLWVTVNEPVLWCSLGYWRRRWPPRKRNWWQFDRAVNRLAAAHKRSYRVIHKLQPDAQVGIAKHFIHYVPGSDRPLDRLAVRAVDWWFNHRWWALTWPKHDFIGVNYYLQRRVGLKLKPPFFYQLEEGEEKSDLGWPIAPEGLLAVLEGVRQYKKPVYVTENGIADENDSKRSDFIRAHLRVVEKAQQRGVDVRGYFYWSLLDNFEWDLGFGPRFGLVEIDYKTMERKVRPSALVYKAIIEQAGLPHQPH